MFKQAYDHLLAQLSEMPAFISHALGSMPSDLLARLPECDKSPLLEHLWHIRDCDSDLYGARIRRVLREDQPSLEPVDVAAWPDARQYSQRVGKQAIEQFAAVRSGLLDELQALDQPALARSGVRHDGSPVNVLGLIEQLAEHDRDHRWRIAAILRSYIVAR